MNRRRRKKGPVTPATFAFAPPLERQLFPFYSLYGVPRSEPLRVSVPVVTTIEFRASSKEKLCGHSRADTELEQAVRKRLDEEKAKKGLPATEENKLIHFQVSLGPQVVYHLPFHPSQNLAGAEVDAVFQAGVNFVFHDDDHIGFEATISAQGSANYSFLDPNRNDPNEISAGRRAGQGQLQLQLAVVFPNFLGVKGLTFSLLVQGAGAATYQYDPSQRKPALSYSKTLAPGLGISKDLGSGWSVQFQPTVGPNWGNTNTVDITGIIFLQKSF